MKISVLVAVGAALILALGSVLVAPPVKAFPATDPEDCPAFERGVSISIRKGNGTYPNQLNYYLSRGYSTTRARNIATGDANNAFWRSLITQTGAIVDYSTDAELFLDMYFIANWESMDSLGNAFGRAMGRCHARIQGTYPTQILVQ